MRLSAYAQFAVRAFEHEALDYVVKPVTRERLAQAVERARRRLARAAGEATWGPGALTELGAAFGHVPARPERLLVRHASGHQLVPVAGIERFSAEEGLVYAVSGDSRHGTDYTLQELEARFTGAFLRASRSELVSIPHVTSIATNGDGSATLTLSSGGRVHVTRRRAADVRTQLQR